MMTALLILALVVVVVALVGVCCQIAGGSFWGFFHILNNSIGLLLEALVAIISAIADANK